VGQGKQKEQVKKYSSGVGTQDFSSNQGAGEFISSGKGWKLHSRRNSLESANGEDFEAMKKMSFILCVVLISLASWGQAPAVQDHASREDVLKLMNVMRCREMVKSTMDAAMAQLMPAMHQKMKQKEPDISEAELADFDKIMSDYFKQMPFDAMFDAMIPAYEKNLTSKEVKAMIDFYSSPLGQSVLAKMPAVSVDAMKEMQPILLKSMEGMDTYMEAKIKELQKKYPHKSESKPTT
jgi:uncharacterized protein